MDLKTKPLKRQASEYDIRVRVPDSDDPERALRSILKRLLRPFGAVCVRLTPVKREGGK